MAKTTIYGIHADNLFDDKDGGLWHNTEIRTNGTSYEEAYKRMVALVPKVFPTGEGLRYNVYVGVWDDSLPNGGQYVSLTRKEFRERPLPDTQEAYDAAVADED